MKPITDRPARHLGGKRRSLAVVVVLLLSGCGPSTAEYSDEEQVSLMLSNLEARSGESFWHGYLEELTLDGERAIAVTSNVLVSSRICFGLADSAVDADGARIGVARIEIRDTLGNATYDCDVEN